MHRSLKIRRKAKADLAAIVDYLAPRSPDAAHRFLMSVDEDFAFLLEYPNVGTLRSPVPKKLKGLRSWGVTGFRNYLIFFRPVANRVEIIRILHGAQNIDRIIDQS